MVKLDEIQKRLLLEIADLHQVPEGAYNIRSDSESVGRQSTANIEIVSKTGVSGLEIRIKPGTKNESVHIPVVLTKSGIKETVYNDFFIGEDADVVIVAGCGIDNCGNQDSQHDGVHRFFVGKNAKVRYVEKHYGSGSGSGKRVLNPVTEVFQEEGSVSPTGSDEEGEMQLRCIPVSPHSPFQGKTLPESGLRDKWHCMLVGVEKADGNLHTPNVAIPFEDGDILWLVGEASDLKQVESV